MKVVKRDGSLDNFDPQKIKNVSKAAGLSEEDANKVADNITTWITSTNKDKLTTIEIRDKVIMELQAINKKAADFFIWYEKRKDNGHI